MTKVRKKDGTSILSWQKCVIILVGAWCISSFAHAQTEISGHIFDRKTEEPLPGSTVYIKTEGRGTYADANGYFEISTNKPLPLVLEIRSLGYKTQTVNVYDASEALEAAMEVDSKLLQDVIVIGYGTTTQEKNTGSVGTIDAETVKQGSTEDLLMALQGRIPGVSINLNSGIPGAGAEIQIRGLNTFPDASGHACCGGGNGVTMTDPLILVDGIPFQTQSLSSLDLGTIRYMSPLSVLNPSDIESIDVLKDADATAIYGARGANGVVLITTKKGAPGRIRIQAEASSGFSRIVKNMDMMNVDEYLNIRNEAFQADGITPNATNAYDLLEWGNNYNTDWQKELYGNTAKVYDAQLSVSGGNEETRFVIAGGYYESGSIIFDQGEDKLSRLNGRLNVHHVSKDKRLKFTATATYSSAISKNTGADFSRTLTNPPNQPMYNSDGSIYWGPGNSSFSTPLRYKARYTKNDLATFIGGIDLGYKVLKNLEAKINFGYTRTAGELYSKYGNDYYNPYANNSTDNYAYFANQGTSAIVLEPQLVYTQRISDGKLSALLGGTVQKDNQQEIYIDADNFPSEKLMGNVSAASLIYATKNTTNEYRYVSLFGRVNYDWKDRYVLNVVARRDGSTRFYRNHRYGTFWSVGTGWILTKEQWLRDLLPEEINYLKLRASYGTVGNGNVGNYQYLESYSLSSRPYNSESGMYPTRIANKSFKWEIDRKFNAALEVSAFQNRILLTAEWYRNRSNDQLVDYALPAQSGFDGYRANLDAIIQNTGFEFAANVTAVETPDFKWMISANLTLPDNKLVEYPDLALSSNAATFEVGKSLYILRAYQFSGIDPNSGFALFKKEDGTLSIYPGTDSRAYVDAQVKAYGGLFNSLTWKDFQLDIFFNFRRKPVAWGWRHKYDYPLGTMYNMPRSLVADYWSPDNTDGTRPGLTSSSDGRSLEDETGTARTLYSNVYQRYWGSDATFSDASFIRLKTAALWYTIPVHWSRKIGVEEFKVYVLANNLLTFTNYDGFDPETEAEIPPAKTLKIGFRLSF
jgi:TonB-linked SusC/RagA family outer membrane protein